MKKIIHITTSFTARVFAKLSRVLASIARKYEPSNIQSLNVISSTNYDMVEAADEPFYASQYWNIIESWLDRVPSSANILDLGCSQGRFSMMFAKHFPESSMVACDISPSAIEQAKDYAKHGSLENIEFKAQSIRDCLAETSSLSIDIVIFTEVTIFYPEWLDDLPTVFDVLLPGGLLVISFRSQYFDALCLIRGHRWEALPTVLEQRQGPIFGSSTTFTWQTSAEVKSILVDKIGFELLELRGIGTCSGIPGDPHADIAQPSKLSSEEHAQLMRLELEIGRSVPDGGRYILAVARKPLA